jgi:hypothetical protein
MTYRYDPATFREAARQCREEAKLYLTGSRRALLVMARRFDNEAKAAEKETSK